MRSSSTPPSTSRFLVSLVVLFLSAIMIIGLQSRFLYHYSFDNKKGENSSQSHLSSHYAWILTTPLCSDLTSVVNNSAKVIKVSKNTEDVEIIKNDPLCSKRSCGKHSYCFLGACVCHPGYSGDKCNVKMNIANPWYTYSCPNLHTEFTMDINVPLNLTGGEHSVHMNSSLKHITSSAINSIDKKSISKHHCVPPASAEVCAYLCYSHPTYGTAVVPFSLWHAAQVAEGNLWVKESRGVASDQNDRAAEHWSSFDKFSTLTALLKNGKTLGRVIEVGAGPWTQFKGMLHIRPDLISSVKEFTVWEPNAKRYISAVTSCSYKSGTSLARWDGKGAHPFPVLVQSDGGELLTNRSNSTQNLQYDTVISINVIEHTQDVFKYLTGLYVSLKTGGILIFHDRYYDDEHIKDGDMFHPIRIKQEILDRFLGGFSVLFNNCSAGYDGRVGEHGYYVIAIKL